MTKCVCAYVYRRFLFLWLFFSFCSVTMSQYGCISSELSHALLKVCFCNAKENQFVFISTATKKQQVTIMFYDVIRCPHTAVHNTTHYVD